MGEFIFKACGLAVMSAVLVLILKRWNGDVAVCIKIICGVGLAALCLSGLTPVIEYLREIGAQGGNSEALGESASLMLRVLAVALVTHISANICRDCGEGTLAGYLEIGGKVEIIILSLPTLKSIIDIAVGML